MLAESAAVEEVPVWLEVNGEPAVTWMCTPDQLEELATGWLHGEGYIETLDDLVKLRPCATDLGFWAEVKPERVTLVKGALDARAGGVMQLQTLDRLLAEEVTTRLEGKSINAALPEFADGGRLATGEALAVYVWERIAPRLPAGVTLHAVRVQEGPHIYSEYFGEV